MSSPIEIVTDEWGVTHISAESADDVFFGQGYAAAMTRLLQMELWRRRGLGLLAEVFGEDYVELDVAARTFLYRGSVDDECDAYGAGTRETIAAFVAGVNHRIAEVLASADGLPLEFAAAGFAPAPWSIDDVLRIRLHGLHSNAEEEITRAVTLRDFGADIEDLRKPRDPREPLTVAEGLDLDAIDPAILSTYHAAHAPFVLPGAGGPAARPALDGSNNWAVAGSRTASGRPLVATDPHRLMTWPSLRTVVHLTCPEFDAIGMNEPYMPGVSGGHNGRVAFGFTIAPTDVEDVYAYDLDESGERYRYGAEWEALTTLVETIPIAGAEAREVTILFTRHGPVLHVDR